MRNYCTIATAIWRNEEFTALSSVAQRMYLLLITQQDITPIGTLPITLNRWAGFGSDTGKDEIVSVLQELTDARFVVIDWDNEELLVRTFVRWDGGHTNPKRLASIKASAAGLRSKILGPELAAELDSLGVEHAIPFPQVQGHSVGVPTAIPDEEPAAESPSERPRSVVTYVTTDSTLHTPDSTLHTPESTTHTPGAGAVTTATAADAAPRRGHRIPDQFFITEKMRTWAADEVPGLDLSWYTKQFVDHWRSATRNATKLDWVRAWQKWMRDEFVKPNHKTVNGHGPPQRSTAEARAGQAWDLANQIRAEEAAAESIYLPQIGPSR